MTLQRHMFVNYDNDTVVIEVHAYETVDIYALLPDGETYQEYLDTAELEEPNEDVYFELHIPAGEVWGFGVYTTPDYDNPDPEQITIKTGSGKNPWPPPPPPPPTFGEDFSTRYGSFLMGLGGERETAQARIKATRRVKQIKRVKRVERAAQAALKPTGTR